MNVYHEVGASLFVFAAVAVAFKGLSALIGPLPALLLLLVIGLRW